MTVEATIERVRNFYEDEARSPKVVTSLDEIPFSFDMIGPEWMTAILCADVPGAKVTKVTLDEADDGTSNRRRIFLEYNAAGQAAGLPRSVFSKGSIGLLNRINLGLSGGAEAEVEFYDKIRPLVKADLPVPRFAKFEADTFKSIIVLDDMEGEVEFCRHWTPISREQIRSQLDLISTYHARFLEDPKINVNTTALVTWPDFFQAVVSYGHENATNAGLREADREGVVPKRLMSRFDEVWPATLFANEEHRRLPATLIHGDCHLKQWYIRKDTGTMGVSDWQCASFGHWSRDLAYMTATSLSVEDRRAWEGELVPEYREMMLSKGAAMPSLDETWLRYRQNMAGALSWWTGTLTPTKDQPDMQPRDTSLEFIKRLSHAMDDLDSIDACKG
jgi:hypothetical protein